jgi:hypothetical protein
MVGAYKTIWGAYTTGEVNLLADDRPLRVRSISVDADLLNTLAFSRRRDASSARKKAIVPGAWRHRSQFSRTSCGKRSLEDS